MNPNQPYNDLPLLPPTVELENNVAILKKAIAANKALAELKGAVKSMDKAIELIKSEAPKIYSKDLVETIFEHPYCKIRFLEEAGIAKRQTAATYLQTLESIGLLRNIKKGREQYYINDELVKILSK
ncbi:MAG TPA: hypothetical protein VJN02_00015 [Gammaproteobacteria bacterium]|nr:hypothetical protein [Gammaproteobacteria bacterium]